MEFDKFHAMPISDVFIAKKYQTDKVQWKFFDIYKLNYGYDSEISENGMLVSGAVDNDLVGMNFSSARRQNLQGVNVTCGLVVLLFLCSK